MKQLISKLSRNKSFLTYVILALIPLILVTYFVIHISTSMLLTNSQDLIRYQSSHIVKLLNDESNSLVNLCYSMLTNYDLRNLCIRFERRDNEAYTTALINENLELYMAVDPNICLSMFISSDYRYTLIQQYRSSNNISEWEDPDYRKEIFDQVKENSTVTLFPAQKIDSTYDISPVFYVAVPVRNNVRKYTYGTLILGIQKSYFNSAFFDSDTDDQPEIFDLSRLLFVDENNSVVYANDPDLIGKQHKNCISKENLTKENYIVKQYRIDHTNWNLWVYCPKKLAFKSVTKGKILIYALILLYAVFLLYFTVLIISHQNKKIQAVASGIRQFQGDEKDYRIPLFANENLNIIITQFNLMADRVTSLSNHLKMEQEKNKIELNLRRKAELKIMEAQINPHFLYNTLDTINWMAIERNEMEISSMLGSLGSLLRYSVTNIDCPVLIRAELEWIKKYLFLQSKRFQNLFTYQMEIEPGVENLTIYKMLLQPLIENCILHGFCDISEGGNILIKMHTEDSFLIITISDNGCGLSPEKLLELNHMAQNPRVHVTENIGFLNVFRRLHAYYGDRFQFHIQSKNGTEINIFLPLQDVMLLK